jgi:hypothetical protein
LPLQIGHLVERRGPFRVDYRRLQRSRIWKV